MRNLLPKDEETTRFLFQKGDFSRPDQKKRPDFVRIKKQAVAPMLNEHGEYETSLMHTTSLPEKDVESLGREHVGKIRDEELVAYVRFGATVVYETGLEIDHDKNGHLRHCSIKGWPALKEDWLERADDLATAITNHETKVFKEL